MTNCLLEVASWFSCIRTVVRCPSSVCQCVRECVRLYSYLSFYFGSFSEQRSSCPQFFHGSWTCAKTVFIRKPKETQNKNTDPDKLWLKIFNLSLKQKDKNIIINKDMLNDRIIDAAQIIMKNQFKHSPQINGFQPTIFKQNTKHFKKTNKDMLQILHRDSANSGHWFSVSTLNCDEGSINIYDSAFNDLVHPDMTEKLLTGTLSLNTNKQWSGPRQQGTDI